MIDGITTRPFEPARDDAFSLSLYATTVGRDLAMLPEPIRAQLLAAQHRAWTASLARYEALDDRVIERDGRPIGRLVLSRPEGVLHVVDIGLVPEARGGGLGTLLLTALFAEADAQARAVRLSTRRDGAARRLYERLGMQLESEDELHARYLRAPR